MFSIRTRSLFTVLAASLAVFAGRAAHAQASATGSINITATVLAPLSIVPTQSLQIGKVGQGVNKTIGVDAAGSGRFSVQGQGTALVDVTLTLPTNLTSGANTLPITGWTGSYIQGPDAPGGTSFTPVSGQSVNRALPGPASNTTAVFSYRIGATVQPAGTQSPGDYVGTIGIQAVYTEI
ncbi:MAG TPA: hypothetical protein VGF17_14175 [Phytomonospora sp.]